MSQPRILMCPPDYYGIEYEINPWMDRGKQADHAIAVRQWNDLHSLLTRLGVQIELLPPVAGLPDLVFTANAALIYRERAILSRFRHAERQGEEPVNAAWLAKAGFQVDRLDDDEYFEGAGDALFCGDTLYSGYRIRSDARAHQHVGEMIACRVIPLELVSQSYYHLDTCFCALAEGTAIYFPGAFDAYGRNVLEDLIEDLVPVDTDEAGRFACNAVVVNRTVITNTGCPQLQRDLRSRGFDAIETPLDEFVKAGGSAKCLTLRLDGEEAANWKQPQAG